MCTIHSKVVEDHQKELHPGAVLVLRQVRVNQFISHASLIPDPIASFSMLLTPFDTTGV